MNNNENNVSLSDLANGAIPTATPVGMPVKPKLNTANVREANISEVVRPSEPEVIEGTGNPMLDKAFLGINSTIARLQSETDTTYQKGKEERIEKATKFGYDAYISLHANSCKTPNTGSGYEAYSNNLYTLSKEIVDDLSETYGLPNRTVQATPYYNRLIPNSSLIELGFVNNDIDRDILVNKQDEVAQIIANNILKQYKPKAETKTIDTNNGSFNILINYK